MKEQKRDPPLETCVSLARSPARPGAPLVETRCNGASLEKTDSLRALIQVTSTDLEQVNNSIGKLASQLKAIKGRGTINRQIQELEVETNQAAEAATCRKKALKEPFDVIKSKRAETKNKLWNMVVANPAFDIASLARQLTDDAVVISEVLADLKKKYTDMLATGSGKCHLYYTFNDCVSWKRADLLQKIEEIERFLASKEMPKEVRVNGETYEQALSEDKDHLDLVARHSELQERLSGMKAELKMADEIIAEHQSVTAKGKKPDKGQEPQGARIYRAVTDFVGTAAAGVGIVMAAAQSVSIGASLVLAGAAFVGANRLLRKGDKALKALVHGDAEEAEIVQSLEFNLDELNEERKTLMARQERLVLALAETEKSGHENTK